MIVLKLLHILRRDVVLFEEHLLSIAEMLMAMWKRLYQVKVTSLLTVGQSVSLAVEPHLGFMTRYLLLFDSYGLVFVGRSFWREDGTVFCICCWFSPAQSFSGPSPLDLGTIFYSISFQTSLFVASYDSLGHLHGIRPLLQTGPVVSLLNLQPWLSVFIVLH
jgi:hypothetical protein